MALVVNILTLEITEHKLYQIVVGVTSSLNLAYENLSDLFVSYLVETQENRIYSDGLLIITCHYFSVEMVPD